MLKLKTMQQKEEEKKSPIFFSAENKNGRNEMQTNELYVYIP